MSPLESEIPSHGMGLQHPGQWSDDESEMSPRKRMRVCEQGYASDHTVMTEYGEQEARGWTQTHLDAADPRHPAILTPPVCIRNVCIRNNLRLCAKL